MFSPALDMAAAVSRKKHRFRFDASSGVRGGERRVLTTPGRGALVMMASAHLPVAEESGSSGERIRSGARCWCSRFFTLLRRYFETKMESLNLLRLNNSARKDKMSGECWLAHVLITRAQPEMERSAGKRWSLLLAVIRSCWLFVPARLTQKLCELPAVILAR